MKDYEIYSNLKVPRGSKIISRLDGRNFHNLTKKLNLNKPYDDNFIESMVNISRDIFNEFSPLFIYTFSDELNVLLSEIPFSGRIEKLNSVFSSLASSSMLKNLIESFDINVDQNISFDSRIIPVSNDTDIVKYFKWRQDEAWRNYVNSYGYWTLKKDFSPEIATDKLKNLKSSGIHQMLFEKGINLNDLPTYQKRGIGLYKEKKESTVLNPKTGKKEGSHRNYVFIDRNLSIFDKKFFKKINIL
ncbi:hypothetical protein ALNOE001_03550 [Candidatus Methanobinarius endosymbioticus]|uniref:tRNA(His) guanylyltransferase n=1 Tax=Candidatus Methanobinarius endosymbioticus TaxID=2006182 RepID=A0A366MDB4_9EURY|nr:hypothetical protein ALNOE001_03550 [Candidatus Methanobinarius endosymbioticus]